MIVDKSESASKSDGLKTQNQIPWKQILAVSITSLV